MQQSRVEGLCLEGCLHLSLGTSRLQYRCGSRGDAMNHVGAWHGKGSKPGRISAVLVHWLQGSRAPGTLPCAVPQACPTGSCRMGSTGCSAGETDMKVHCCVAAYISDYAFLGTALLPHRQYRIKFMASLDHSMWFHAPFRADHWMLYECESPWAGKSLVCF